MILLNISLTSRIILSLIVSIPSSVFISFFIIEHYKLNEAAWPKTVLRSSLILGVIIFFLF